MRRFRIYEGRKNKRKNDNFGYVHPIGLKITPFLRLKDYGIYSDPVK